MIPRAHLDTVAREVHYRLVSKLRKFPQAGSIKVTSTAVDCPAMHGTAGAKLFVEVQSTKHRHLQGVWEYSMSIVARDGSACTAWMDIHRGRKVPKNVEVVQDYNNENMPPNAGNSLHRWLSRFTKTLSCQ